MAQTKPRDVLSLSGRLVKNPANFTTAFPHGGTALGDIRSGTFRLGSRYGPITAAEYGLQEVDRIRSGEAGILVATLRDYDPDALAAVFPNTAAGAVTRERVVRGSLFGAGVVKPGKLVSDQAMTLLLSPRDSVYGIAILIYNALPLVEESAEIQLRLKEEYGVAVAFLCTPRSDGKLWEKARLKDLTA